MLESLFPCLKLEYMHIANSRVTQVSLSDRGGGCQIVPVFYVGGLGYPIFEPLYLNLPPQWDAFNFNIVNSLQYLSCICFNAEPAKGCNICLYKGLPTPIVELS